MCGAAVRPALFCLALLLLTGCKEEGGVRVSRFSFTGNEAVSTTQLRQVLATQPSSRLPWGEKRYFSREQFEADLKRIVAFYTDRGFPEARVSSFDAQLSEDQASVRIVVNIEEGEPVRLERLEFEGFEALPDDHRASMEQRMPLKAGQPVDRALLQANRETALDELRDHGHPYASVRIVEQPGTAERLRVVVLRGEAGPLTHHGDVEVAGNQSVGDNVVQRQLTYKPGDLFQVSKLRESQRKLYGLELFQFANVEPIRGEGRPTVIPTRVTVTEGKHRRVNFSGGYGTEEKARAEVDWRHVNFFGGARTASVRARYSKIDGGARVNFTQPYVFSPRYILGLSAQVWHTSEPAYTLNTRGGRASITRQFTRGGGQLFTGRPSMTLGLTYVNEHEEYEISNEALLDLTFRDELIALGLDPRRGFGIGRRSAFMLDASRNTTDNILDATRGYLAAIHVERAGQFFGGTYDYYEVTGEARYFQRLGSKLVLAAQARGGSIDAVGDPEVLVPFFKRYFLGGATNLRGWGRFEVSPLSGFGLPIGGTTFMNFSTEARFPIWGNLSGVLFLDGGNVWPGAWDFDFRDLRYDVGPGLRYNTPIGPFRLDLGYQLNPIDGLIVNGELQPRQYRIHFSIGQAF